MIFIQYYLSCYQTLPEATNMKCFCNNLGVITNIMTLLTSKVNCPNNTTNDNCDLTRAIADIVRRCHPLEMQLLYVKGHQDAKANQPLTLEEQHNVECDRLAKEYVTNTTQISTNMTTLEFKATQPHLHIAGKVICC